MLGKKFAECLQVSFDVYQQECGPHQQRGDDRMFLYRKRTNNNSEDDDSYELAFLEKAEFQPLLERTETILGKRFGRFHEASPDEEQLNRIVDAMSDFDLSQSKKTVRRKLDFMRKNVVWFD